MVLLPLLAVAALTPGSFPDTTQDTVDFRYSPGDWRSMICMPTDPVKTIVWKDGTLDNMCGLSLRPTPAPGAQWTKQELVSPRVPIVITRERAGDLEITEKAFVSPIAADPQRVVSPFVQRLGAFGTIRDWASPTVPCEPAYRNAATERQAIVHYRFSAQKGHTYTVVLGFCEGAKNGPGDRVLDIEINHKRRRRLDLAAEFGRNRPILIPFEARDDDGDGGVDLAIAPLNGCKDEFSLLNVLWVFDGKPRLNLDELLLGRSEVKPLAHLACGDDERDEVLSPSANVALVRLQNTGSAPIETKPEFTVGGPYKGTASGQDVCFGPWTATGTEPFSDVPSENGRTTLRFASQTLAPGAERTVAVTLWRGTKSGEVPRNAGEALALERKTESFWRKLGLPYDSIQVPDQGIQAVYDAGLRCIYQNQDYKSGVPVFQVGPTVYRDVSPEDGSFLIEQAVLLGRLQDAAATLDYFLSFQQDNGRLWVYTNFWKENGLLIWDVVRYARLTGDLAFLQSRFAKLEGIVGYIEELRRRSEADPKALNYGLIPNGWGDGGNGGVCAEYSNVIWCLAGLYAGADGAQMLGRSELAGRWRREADEMAGYLRKAMHRDALRDKFGNLYVPNAMGSDGNIPPAKGQYVFLQGVYPAKVLQPTDPLVQGMFAMLRAVEVEGLPQGGGWLDDGVWPYFSHFQAEALLWAGRGQEAAGLLYAIANHYSPVLSSWEEQQLQSIGRGTGGDMPHNWGSAEFIRQVRYMLALERGSELHLFEGLPPQWAKPGMVTQMRGVVTEFGPLSFSLQVSADGKSATLDLDVPTRVQPTRVVVHLAGLAGRAGTIDLPTTGHVRKLIPL